ncbi:MAG: NAD(P)/FAD-dependent oxidoreductase, partial [bacterium]
GRSGVLARRGWRKPETGTRTIAVAGVWEREGEWPAAEPSHTLVESYAGGWAWSVPVSSRRRFVTVMLDPSVTDIPGRAQLVGAYAAEIERTTMLRDLVAGATPIGEVWGCDASPYSATRVAEDGVLLIGDAASFVDPLSSFGVKKALASAWLGAVVVHSAVGDAAMTSPATELFAERERAMYDHLQQQSAALSLEAAGAHAGSFWTPRSENVADEAADGLDVSALRSNPRVLAAFDELKRRSTTRLRLADSAHYVDRAMVRGRRVVLEDHLAAPSVPAGVRYCRNVDLVLIARLAPLFDQVPDLFEAYNRAAPPAPLPDFLGALSALIGLDLLLFA